MTKRTRRNHSPDFKAKVALAAIKIDAADADFGKLRIWQDANGDGVSDPGELKTLAELGIASLSLTRSKVTGTNQGNGRGYEATFTRTDGTTGTSGTIYFQTEPRATEDSDRVSMPAKSGTQRKSSPKDTI